jgi:hypothetical protein
VPDDLVLSAEEKEILLSQISQIRRKSGEARQAHQEAQVAADRAMRIINGATGQPKTK